MVHFVFLERILNLRLFHVQQIPQLLSSVDRYDAHLHKVINDIPQYKELKKSNTITREKKN